MLIFNHHRQICNLREFLFCLYFVVFLQKVSPICCSLKERRLYQIHASASVFKANWLGLCVCVTLRHEIVLKGIYKRFGSKRQLVVRIPKKWIHITTSLKNNLWIYRNKRQGVCVCVCTPERGGGATMTQLPSTALKKSLLYTGLSIHLTGPQV